jgi:hypothetical protein
MEVAAHHADVILPSQLLKLFARSSPIDGKFVNLAHGIALQVDKMRARLAFWLEHDRIAVFWINSPIVTDRCGVHDGHVQIDTAASTSLTDHFVLRYPLLFLFGKIRLSPLSSSF